MVGAASLAMLLGSVFLVSVVFSMLGQGGGVVYTPLQVYQGIDFHTAATTSLFLIMMTSLSATVVFRRAKRVDWPLAVVLETVTATGGFAGGLLSDRFSGQVLSVTFAVIVGIAAAFMIGRFQPLRQRQLRRGSFAWRREYAGEAYTVDLLVALPASLLVGAASGLVGVGGGILKVPLMVLMLGIPMEIAVGSSAFMVGVTAAGGFAGHLVSGHWDWRLSLVLAVGVVVGGQIGARRSIAIDRAKLQVGFGWLILAIAGTMILKAML